MKTWLRIYIHYKSMIINLKNTASHYTNSTLHKNYFPQPLASSSSFILVDDLISYFSERAKASGQKLLYSPDSKHNYILISLPSHSYGRETVLLPKEINYLYFRSHLRNHLSIIHSVSYTFKLYTSNEFFFKNFLI